jgi:arsenate reductase-like glutaredoxin family protein
MTLDEAVAALSQDGMLVKRPFILTKEHGLVGFKPEEWAGLKAS